MTSHISNPRAVPVWNYAKAHTALPYLRNVLGSLRDYTIDQRRHELLVERLNNSATRLNRDLTLALSEANYHLREARRGADECRDEMESLGIFCLNPLRGQALVPFVRGGILAWYLLDLFDETPLMFWRYHNDPQDMRRPIAEVLNERQPTLVA